MSIHMLCPMCGNHNKAHLKELFGETEIYNYHKVLHDGHQYLKSFQSSSSNVSR
jgi:hypothetical protein